jgi:hypothetical protein
MSKDIEHEKEQTPSEEEGENARQPQQQQQQEEPLHPPSSSSWDELMGGDLKMKVSFLFVS